jgi:hypothetical protein
MTIDQPLLVAFKSESEERLSSFINLVGARFQQLSDLFLKSAQLKS